MFVMGTRPEAIKLSAVYRAMDSNEAFDPFIVSTGQHREMLDQMLDQLGLHPAFDLRVMEPSQSLSALTGRLVSGVDALVREKKPDLVMVQGDTTTAMCAALAAFYNQTPVAHVEAGLRSGVDNDPFPEEMNRRLVGSLARWHFPPTQLAVENLLAEGVTPDRMILTGNTVIDSLLWVLENGLGTSAFSADSRRVLVTLHRRENQGAKMKEIAEALARIASRGDVEIVLPVHMSPAVRDSLLPTLSGLSGVTLTEPLDYLDFIASLAACDLVLTDSGGVQEEAPTLGKPVLVIRDTTERPEAIEAGVASLVGCNPDDVYAAASSLLDDPDAYRAMARRVNPYGDGKAADRIVSYMEEALH